MNKKNWLIGAIIVLTMVLTACSNDEQVTETESEPETDDEPVYAVEEGETDLDEEDEEEPTFEYAFPYTGEGTNEEITNRAVAVMVNNHPKARPQSGLTKADIVFEILAEGDITRLMAFFQSEQPDIVGPVRSARPYYFNLADDYNALYVYHGAATFIENMLQAGAADNLNGAYYDNDRNLFKREDFRVAPHNSYLLFNAVYDVASQKGYDVEVEHKPLPFLSTEEMDSLDGEQATEISYAYDTTPVRYEYNSETEKYSRFNGDVETLELADGEAVQLDNIFFIEAHHQVIDDAGRREVDFQSGGDAYLFQKGTMKQLQWKNVDGQIIPVDDGEPVGLVPGQTWVNVVPSSGLAELSFQ
ncbi:DUF3048 domain-containing protein [Aquibacillus sediminis]|uniref:DUF3048 domain-containing protein n=1 Tax=Aquibacillus sediminis TaxID=2574734 RepID=UPI001FE74638|nr:DUF3048 domain-containing protein [Aquibacillus sediminis]